MSKHWEFHELRHRAGYQEGAKLAALCGVTVRTVQNWERGGPPDAVKTLLQLLAKDLEWMGPEWAGFRFHQGELLGPSGEWITPGMIRAYPRLESAMEHYRRAALEERQQRKPGQGRAWLAKLAEWLK